jgi:hypothetical protein
VDIALNTGAITEISAKTADAMTSKASLSGSNFPEFSPKPAPMKYRTSSMFNAYKK